MGAPDVQVAFGLSYATAALVLFVVPQVVSFLLEPPLFVLADRLPRKPLVVGGLAAMGASLVLAGLAPSLSVFAVAMALVYPASGVGVNLAQATLVDAHPDQRERLMARWAFMGALGDLATPALFAALAAVSLGWREAFVITGSAVALYSLALIPFRFPTPGSEECDAPTPPLREALRDLRRNGTLFAWLAGVALCGLLDEVLVAFAALHLEHALGATLAERGLVLAAFMLGEMLSLAVVDRLLQRMAPLRLLRWSAAACTLAYVAWVAAPGLVASAVMFAVVGACAAPLYPIAKAQAYRALPGQSGLVIAAAQLFAPLELGAALLVGLAADAFGLTVALCLLAIQPLGLLVLAVRLGRRRGETLNEPAGWRCR